MSAGSAFPVRETITKAAAVSYLAVRSYHVLAHAGTMIEASIRLAIAIVIETPIFVLACAILINVVLLNFLVPTMKAVARKARRRAELRSRAVGPLPRRPAVTAASGLCRRSGRR
ncbi:hypothetical protein FF100_18560 [Methylobacterium terricola]|uniref:Uncharacterized protein n=1 Tax=Methylobacterium terricola TaxID=2583531 RepID=A0A5C4LFW1_9HYPH|nr:hypothetical protein [Methylobacterium terricola]TNC11648.1 hypothetical protein FF100_18560 [Methylobacterium terricola]